MSDNLESNIVELRPGGDWGDQLEALMKKVQEATAEFKDADDVLVKAKKYRSAALEYLNAVQEEFDARIAELCAGAPKPSCWGQK